ncbi:MAG: hypothetical protein ACJ8EU_18865 [Xanthobacteraceae bacterium]
MYRKFAISAAVMFVIAMALGFFVHGVLLYGDYARLPNVMRPPAEAQAKMPLMVLAYVSLAVAFTWIYLKGKEDKPWLAQGARYGLAIAMLTAVPTYLSTTWYPNFRSISPSSRSSSSLSRSS